MIIAVLDACVLYPPSLRDLLMWMATVRIYAPRLTEEIHAEWIRNVLANNLELTLDQLDRTRRLVNQVIPGCVVSGYEKHISTMRLPDPNDRHVLAAAIEAHAEMIVTFNLPDFPDTMLRKYGVRAIHPDNSFAASLTISRNSFCVAFKRTGFRSISRRRMPRSIYRHSLRTV